MNCDNTCFLKNKMAMVETWIYRFDPEQKIYCMHWKTSSTPLSKNGRVTSSSGNVLSSGFFRM